jgi:hypothetical protein
MSPELYRQKASLLRELALKTPDAKAREMVLQAATRCAELADEASDIAAIVARFNSSSTTQSAQFPS